MNFRIGIGIDVHKLVDNHPFWLGGILIPHYKGAFGHSDADTLIHAICDALLGASNLGDIGKLFPDSDNKYKNIDSKILLKQTVDLVTSKGFSIVNIDATISLEKPKISKYIPEMKAVLSNVIGISTDVISIKATTTEKLGFVGNEEGIKVDAICLLNKNS